MVKFRESPIYPAIAAVLVAAAFVFMCVFAPSAYAANTYTSSVVNERFNSLVNHYNFSNVEVQQGAFISAINGNLYETRVYTNPSIVFNDDGSVTCSGTCYLEQYNSSNGGYNFDSHPRSFTLYDTYIRIQTSSYDYQNFYYTDNSSRYILGFGLPESCYESEVGQSAYRSIYENRSGSGSFGFGASLPHLSSSQSLTSYYDSYIKPSVNSPMPPPTTTTTTVTTTTTTTTTVTLATFPYQTNPPFELPSEWLGDYSETVPVPSVAPVTTVDVSGYDDILSDAENSFLSAIGFWFLAMKDFLSMNPTITYIAVFTIAIVLIILLLYNRGDDN